MGHLAVSVEERGRELDCVAAADSDAATAAAAAAAAAARVLPDHPRHRTLHHRHLGRVEVVGHASVAWGAHQGLASPGPASVWLREVPISQQVELIPKLPSVDKMRLRGVRR